MNSITYPSSRQARALGDYLIVGLNPDADVIRYVIAASCPRRGRDAVLGRWGDVTWDGTRGT